MTRGLASALEMGVEHALQQASVTAHQHELWLEFGSFTGGSTATIAGAHHVYAFDSFRGLPEHWRTPHVLGRDAKSRTARNRGVRTHTGKGAFDVGGVPPFDGGSNITWEVGWFNETLPRFLARHTTNVRFLHIDCDLYSSASMVLSSIAPRLSPGAIIVFDELINFPEFEAHEMRALLELQAASGRCVHVLGTSSNSVSRSAADSRRELDRYGGESIAMRRGYRQDAVMQLQ